MMDIRLTSFVLGLLFVLQALRDSSAYAHQGEERVVEKGNEVAVQKALFNGVNAAHLKKTGLGGRKMAGQKVLSTEIGRGDMLNGGTSELSGAVRSDGILDLEVKGDFKVKRRLGDSSSTPKKYKEDGFVAFTADYHGPKHHSPIHN